MKLTDQDVPRVGVPQLRDEPTFELVVNNTGRFCPHPQVMVCRHERKAECGTCGVPLDPFDALLRIAQEHARWELKLKTTKAECENARVRLEDLKRIERNAVSRLARKGIKVEGHYRRKHAAEIELAKRNKAPKEAK